VRKIHNKTVFQLMELGWLEEIPNGSVLVVDRVGQKEVLAKI
jgi:hypothetical protein